MTDTLMSFDLSWYERAGCRGLPSDLFFLDCERDEYASYKRKLSHTQDICAKCEVVKECFNHALSIDESYGVWGGVDFQVRGKPNRNRTRRMKFFHEQHNLVLRKAEKLKGAS